jgi:hypothetical protein
MFFDSFFNWTPGKPFVPMQCRFMSNQSEAASVLCKPIGIKLSLSTYGVNTVTDTLISKHRENCNSLSDCYCTSVNTTSLAQDFMEHAETFFT